MWPQVYPPKPVVVSALQPIAADDAPDIMGVARLISQDVGLSGVVLKQVNSAFFGMRRKVSDIQQAAVLLGLDKIIHLVTAYEMRKALSGKACISMERFWDTSCDTARVCTLIAHELDARVPLEDLYAVGLFHDCGIPPMAMCFPDYRDYLQQANRDYQQVMTETELRRYRISHAQVGYALATSWNIPPGICEIVLQHHEPDAWGGLPAAELRVALAVLKLAEQVVDAHRRKTDNIDWSRAREPVCKVLGVEQGDLESLMDRVGRQWLVAAGSVDTQ